MNSFITKEINCLSIAEDKLKTKYKGSKKWDLHFPNKKIAIEYKSVCWNDTCNSLIANFGNRIEEAIGMSYDLKHQDPEYKVGYIIVISIPNNFHQPNALNWAHKYVDSCTKMVEAKIFDFFWPVLTKGISDHHEFSEIYNFQKFLNDIKNVPAKYKINLDDFLI